MTTPTTSPTPDAERSEVTTALVLGGPAGRASVP